MKDKVNVRQALSVFQKVVDYGERHQGFYLLDGIRASTQDDGYTVTLSDDNITLHVFFHNQCALECENRSQLDQFLLRLKQIEHGDYATAEA